MDEFDEDELTPEEQMLLVHRMSLKPEVDAKHCPHLGVERFIDSHEAMWCPQCWRLFASGEVVPYDQLTGDQKWVVILPPFVIDDIEEATRA